MPFERNGVSVTDEELIESIYKDVNAEKNLNRVVRDKLLAETDWWAVSDRTMTQAETDYRQALRDVPQQDGFPVDITWPTKPE